MTLGLGHLGHWVQLWGGMACKVLRIYPECEKGPSGTALGRKGKSFIEFITGPTFLPVCPGN